MYLENLVIDAVDPALVGRFWEAAIGGEHLSHAPQGYETRLAVEGGPVLDVCVQRVPQPPSEPQRLHVDLSGRGRQAEEVERLLALGARHADIGQGDVPWVVLADPEGNPFCVMEERPAYADSGPIRRCRWTREIPSAMRSSGAGSPAGSGSRERVSSRCGTRA